jgi:hypothetical protein
MWGNGAGMVQGELTEPPRQVAARHLLHRRFTLRRYLIFCLKGDFRFILMASQLYVVRTFRTLGLAI